MDMRTAKWHGQLALSGVGTPLIESGSISHLIGWAMKELMTQKPRQLSNGLTEINLTIRDKPFSGEKKETDSTLMKAIELEAILDDSQMTRSPMVDEPIEHYVNYLVDSGMSFDAAQLIACDHYDLQLDSPLLAWMNDPKAQRFRVLNSVNGVYLTSLPSEYAELKTYVIHTYPQFAAN